MASMSFTPRLLFTDDISGKRQEGQYVVVKMVRGTLKYYEVTDICYWLKGYYQVLAKDFDKSELTLLDVTTKITVNGEKP